MGEVKLGSDIPSVIAITGANGFVGRACVAEARRLGLPVLAIYRSARLPDWAGDEGITPLQLDLAAPTSSDALRRALPEGCALIHAAAHLGDDPKALAKDTLAATQGLRDATQGRAIRLVLISSLAVYDTDQLSNGDSVTETSPLIAMPQHAANAPEAYLTSTRDPYAGAKRLQEALLTSPDKTDQWILRPGAIWGPGRSWHALMGFWASKLHVTIGSDGELPLVHVDHIAQAAIKAAQTQVDAPTTVNVFDDDRPDRGRFLKAHRSVYSWPRLTVTVPFRAWMALVRIVKPISHKLPGLFREPVLRARMMPLRFPNARLRGALGGQDSASFEQLMARTREAET